MSTSTTGLGVLPLLQHFGSKQRQRIGIASIGVASLPLRRLSDPNRSAV